jgi:uncharacterized protein
MSSAKTILPDTSQRTYPLPDRNWKYYQQWHNSTFLHWIIPAEKIKELLPPGLELDTFEGNAWVSLVEFEVKKMSPHYLPPFPYISNFREINVRTYVTCKGIRGIYLFSIETDKIIEVFLTRSFIGLPYEKSLIKKTPNNVVSVNNYHNYFLDYSLAPVGLPTEKSKLDYWLTERHCLYNYHNNKIYRHNIHHKEWDLEEIDISISDVNYDFKSFSLNINPDKIHFSKKLEVLLWNREIV